MMTNNQAKDYATCALWAMYRDQGREPEGKISDKDLSKLIHAVRFEMEYQFDVLTEAEAESKGNKILRKL